MFDNIALAEDDCKGKSGVEETLIIRWNKAIEVPLSAKVSNHIRL